jgi:hypothetical protein
VSDFRFSASTISFAMGNPQAMIDAFANKRNGSLGKWPLAKTSRGKRVTSGPSRKALGVNE